MYCKNCGCNLDDNAEVCPECGVATKNTIPFGALNNNQNTAVYTGTNVVAIVGFILSFIVALAGLICSLIGYKKAPEYNENGRGFAIAGIIISTVLMVFGIVFSLLFVYVIK